MPSPPPRRGTKASFRQRASRLLSDLRKVAAVLQARGEILPPKPWLKVLGNVLSSAPAGKVGKRKDPKAPERWELSYETLAVAAADCGVEATEDEIEHQVEETLAWRQRELLRLGRPHHIMMAPDKIAGLLGVTDEIRREAEAWNIGSIGGSPKGRREARRERQRIRDERRRRADGISPRPEGSLKQTQPWAAQGVSRATWFRRRREVAEARETAERETVAITANKDAEAVRLPRVRPPRLQPMRTGETVAITANIYNNGFVAAGCALATFRTSVGAEDCIGLHEGFPEGEVEPYRLKPEGIAVAALAALQRSRDSAFERSSVRPTEPAFAVEDAPKFGAAAEAEEPSTIAEIAADQEPEPCLAPAELAGDTARLDERDERMAAEIRRQLGSLVALPGGRGFKTKRDPPALIGSTDRFCAACGDWASNEWLLPGGEREWRCTDCEPSPTPLRPAEAEPMSFRRSRAHKVAHSPHRHAPDGRGAAP